MIRVVLLLHNAQLASMPETVKVLENWGYVQLIQNKPYSYGDQVYLEGDKATILAWLEPHGPFWVGVDSPMLQNFQLYDFETKAGLNDQI